MKWFIYHFRVLMFVIEQKPESYHISDVQMVVNVNLSAIPNARGQATCKILWGIFAVYQTTWIWNSDLLHNLGQIRGECDTLTVLYLGKINVKRLTTHRWHLVTKQDKTNNRKKKPQAWWLAGGGTEILSSEAAWVSSEAQSEINKKWNW